ncbi:hypothetical protein FJT64_024847 [Amphibalanus amphitrite]|uniref:Cuticlin-1 n=1 Tax=Amphibalanus amphitrite TaxID=1232801 RepID=A0A6A4WB02_AMPAM|nr:hypothetical protein FJT64_024847 [Amphibalanus amphitrite]
MRSSLVLLTWLAAAAVAQEVDPAVPEPAAPAPVAEETAAPLPLGSAGPVATPAASDCPEEAVSFEVVTGYAYSAPAFVIDSQTGTLLLTDCIDLCRRNASCQALNYETGLCVLLGSTADGQEADPLTESQYPVFTMYVQKMCYAEAPRCDSAWAFERVQNHTLNGMAKKTIEAESRLVCEQACLAETEFVCRSASYVASSAECRLSDMDRHTLAGLGAFQPSEGTDFLENHCVGEPVKLCEFTEIDDRILKTVDSVHQNVSSLEACKELCLSANFRCHTYDYNDTGDKVCRLSHHSVATLTNILEPYLEIPGSTSYELSSCYNVTIDCRAGHMVARIQTSRLFNGKLYAKGSPNTCVTDVTSSLDFELKMGYSDLECDVKRGGPGHYHNEVVLQHHDRIVTSADLGLSVRCQYDLSNKSISNAVDLEVKGDIQPVLEQEAVVDSPNVLMRITDRDGSEVEAAAVGDPLSLLFTIVDPQSPYEIFVRDLVAMDGANSNEILLIDAAGCPTDESILQALLRVNGTKDLASAFDAFKFPTSDVVQFRALVTPCLPRCEPAVCDVLDYVGAVRQTESYGRRRRSLDRTRRAASDEEMLVVQTIRIDDRFSRRAAGDAGGAEESGEARAAGLPTVTTLEPSSVCMNTSGLLVGGAVLVLVQLALLAAAVLVFRRRRAKDAQGVDSGAGSLAQLYDSGYSARRA